MRYKIKLKTISLQLAEDAANYQTEIDNSKKAIDILRGIYKTLDADQEHFTVLFLNRRNVINGFKILHTGGQCESIVDPKILFRNALLFGAGAIIIAHNHPSNNLKPSDQDLILTKQLIAAGKLLKIEIIDHIILTDDNYFSFKQESLL